MRLSRSRVGHLSVAMVLCVTFLACSRGGSKQAPAVPARVAPADRTVAYLPGYESKRPEDGGTFTRALPADVVTLNPVIATDQVSYLVYKWIFDPLVDMDQDMKPVGVLAQSWENSPDNLTTIFHLRKGVTWQDGAPFTADDVVFTYDAAMDPTVDAANKRSAFADVASVKKVDDLTVKVTWKRAFAPGLTAWVFYILPKHVYGYAPGRGADFNGSPKNAAPVGTGPFELVDWRRGDRVVLQANPRYFAGRPHLDRVVFKVIPQAQTQFAAYTTGQLDLTSLSAEQWNRVKDDAGFMNGSSVFEYYSRQFFYIGWNMDGSNPFFADRRVRQAMTYAMNRQAVLDSVLGGHGTVCTGPFYPGGWAYDGDVKPYPYDPAKAGALLDQAGWKMDPATGVRAKDGVRLRFECLVPAEAEMFARWLEIFQQDLKKVGVEMAIRKLEWGAFLDRTNRHQFQAFLSGFSLGDDPDPFPMLDSSQGKLLPDGVGAGQNDVSYSNPEVDRLIETEEGTFDQGKRREALRRIQELVSDDQPCTYLFVGSQMAAVRDRFQGVRVSRAGYGLFSWYPSMLNWWVPTELQKR